MRRIGLVAGLILLASSLTSVAAAETCSTQIALTFHTYSTPADATLAVPNPGSFDAGSMPSCPWHYTQPLDVQTGQPAGTITNVQNSALGTPDQGGFTFIPASGYTGTAYFHTVSDSGEFVSWESFITVSGSGGGGGGSPFDKTACKKGGWKSLTRSDGSSFKNEGDCVSYTSTGK